METLEQLEDDYWGPASTKTTPVIRRSFELRRKSLDQFTPSDIDHMISQRIGLEYLIDRAVSTLFDNPLLEAWAYPGDLLLTVISVDPDFWRSHPDQWREIDFIVSQVEKYMVDLREPLERFRLNST